MDTLKKGATEELSRLLSAAKKEAKEPSASLQHDRFRLRLAGAENVQLQETPPAAEKVQTVWDSPSVSAAILGTEVKGEISVAEQKHVWVGGKRQVWLRLADKTFTAGGGHSTGTGSTGDSGAWVQQDSHNGWWEPAPAAGQGATELQADFFIESSLRLLMHALETDGAAAAILIECTRGFVERLQPLALFDSTSPTIDRALRGMIDWLTARATSTAGSGSDGAVAAEDAAASVVALQLVISLVIARGTLTAILRLAKFLSATPRLAADPAITKQLRQLSAVHCFAPVAQASFAPEPGTSLELLAFWEKSAFERIADDMRPSSEAPPLLDALSDCLKRGDAQAARALVRSKISSSAFAPLHLPLLAELQAAPSTRAYRQAVDEAQMLEDRLLRPPKAESSGATGGATVLAFVLSHLHVLSCRLSSDTRRVVALQGRIPCCMEATAETVASLVALLKTTYGGSIEQLIDPTPGGLEEEDRRAATRQRTAPGDEDLDDPPLDAGMLEACRHALALSDAEVAALEDEAQRSAVAMFRTHHEFAAVRRKVLRTHPELQRGGAQP